MSVDLGTRIIDLLSQAHIAMRKHVHSIATGTLQMVQQLKNSNKKTVAVNCRSRGCVIVLRCKSLFATTKRCNKRWNHHSCKPVQESDKSSLFS